MTSAAQTLLGAGEPPAAEVVRVDGASPYLLVCDHASNRVPKTLGDLGVPDVQLQRHIAWDIGAAGVARDLATMLDAVLIMQNYSRLVIDCNRPFAASSSIAERSEVIDIPGNRDLPSADIEARQREIFQPYHDRIKAELDARTAAGRRTILVAVHSFTRDFASDPPRPWHIGVLYHRDARLARLMLELLRAEDGLVVGDNEPYAVGDESDYTIPVHGERRGLPHVELEIRQDLIGAAAGQHAWAERLARVLTEALVKLP